jgi:polar amino acid transport system substrate-binding protein
MQRNIRIRQFLTAAGVVSVIAATSLSAGAATTKGTYSAMDAKLVPATYKSGTIAVATDATYPPDESVNSSGTMVGFDIDLINAIATTLGVKVKENNVTFGTILAGIDSGKYVIGNSSFTDEKSREKQVNFVDYFQAGEGVYEKAGATLKFTGFKSFCGTKVAVETGTEEQSDAQKVKCTGGKKVDVLAYPTQTEANTAVESGRAQFGFLDSQVAGYVVSTSKGLFKLAGSAVNVEPYGIATPKSASGEKLAKAIQAAVKTLISNGTYGAILTKWGVSAGGLPASKITLNGATS